MDVRNIKALFAHPDLFDTKSMKVDLKELKVVPADRYDESEVLFG
jgi:hypothetical protein